MTKNKTALVTGATSGIGLGIARRLAHEGYDVAINGLGEPGEIARLTSTLSRETGRQVCHCPGDLERPAEIRRLVVEAQTVLGGVDVLINNAGIQFVAPLAEFPEEKWQAILAVNLSAAFFTSQAVIPGMKTKGWGRIVNIASAHGLVASTSKSAYVAAKHGLVGLTKATALDVATDGITCNAICPGFVLTPLVERQIDAHVISTGLPRERVIADVILAKHAIKRFVKIEEIADSVAFLCSESGASVTGAAWAIDAGWTAA